MSIAALQITGVHKRFGEQVVLAGAELVVEMGETVALLGANGTGKTTLLRCVVDLVRPDAGEVRVAGRAVAADLQARGAVGWALGDEHAWFWRLDGRTNLRLFGRMRGMSRRDAATQAELLLGELGLGGAASRPVATYSTGMRARLALARARLGAPRVIILDEVGRGLDEDGEALLTDWLRRQREAAVLIVTHAPPIAAAASRRAVLRDGLIAAA